MRLFLPALVLALGAASGVAQVVGLEPGMQQKDNDIEFTSRSSLPGTIQGRLSTHLVTGQWAGIKRIDRYVFNVQDQNDLTQETVVSEVRLQDSTTGFPNWPAGTLPLFTIPYTLPAGTGVIAAYQVTITPATPIALVGNAPTYLDWQVPINGAWTADGLSIHMSAGLSLPCSTSGNPACCGSTSAPTLGGWESPRGVPASQVNIMDLAPADTAAGPLAYASRDRNYFHWIQTNQPTLRNLAIDPNTATPIWFCPTSNPNRGHAAMRPDVNDFLAQGRNDELGWEVRGGTPYANGIALVFNTGSALSIPINAGFGDLWVNPFDLFFSLLIQGPIVLGGTGVGVGQLSLGAAGNPTRAAVAGFGDLHSQALVIDATFVNYTLSNLSTFSFELGGGTPYAIDATTPVGGSTIGFVALKVQNGGKGNVTVNFLNGSSVIGSFVVLEGTSGEQPIFPGATSFSIVTTVAAGLNNPVKGAYKLR